MAEIQISGYTVLVDDDDVERIRKYKWYINRGSIPSGAYYFITQGRNFPCKTGTVQLHRFIMGCTRGDGTTVDHINRNTLDNRKGNLRLTDCRTNAHNRSYKRRGKYIGVKERKDRGHYVCIVSFDGRSYYLGSSFSAEECARWYDMAVLYFNTEHADTNFPKESYSEEDIKSTAQRIVNIVPTNSTTGYVGVSFDKKLLKYRSVFVNKGTSYWLGSYNTPIEAAIARDAKAFELLSSDARLNFPERVVDGVYNKELICGI